MTSLGHNDDQPQGEVTESTDDEVVDAEVVGDDDVTVSETVGIDNDDPDLLTDEAIELEPDESVDGAVDEEMTLADLFASDGVVKERDEYLDALRRVQAEFDNYRKRMTRQQGEASERAKELLLERLLPVLDALDLALAHIAPDSEESSPEIAALTQIAALLRDTLYKEGLERIDAVDVAFDPTVHDAVAHLPDDPDSEHHGVVIAQVLRAGYQLKGRVVRPAMVQVRG